MPELSTSILFSIAVLGLLVSPGPNMMFLLSHGVTHGVRGGVAVAVGIFLADLILTGLTALGVTAAIAAWPPSFNILRYLGAAYLLWLAYHALRSREIGQLQAISYKPPSKIIRSSALNSLLNPKALLFFMLFLPQFVSAELGNVTLQLVVLGLALSVFALIFHALLGVARCC
jgi:threonine/homoserine/homoserine lactone efflux protein